MQKFWIKYSMYFANARGRVNFLFEVLFYAEVIYKRRKEHSGIAECMFLSALVYTAL